jgi:hypothetical protein
VVAIFIYIPRACQKSEGEFHTFLQPSLRRGCFLQSLGKHQLFAFQPVDPLFAGSNDRGLVGLDKTIKKVLDLALNIAELLLERFLIALS